ncbi:hypothetical protein BCR34DRAFT_11625 [Clohesyomyces aquaticus]|uniref:Uncharacterized protein n=1 Tax=Clohesyomyces aquaticus TaxID=1231657 RepID=A0A1Y1ZF55_9PLEO|nr:hypothetical protein BCR34DRAFT_11625 [Clohesyomyces aquaticus]
MRGNRGRRNPMCRVVNQSSLLGVPPCPNARQPSWSFPGGSFLMPCRSFVINGRFSDTFHALILSRVPTCPILDCSEVHNNRRYLHPRLIARFYRQQALQSTSVASIDTSSVVGRSKANCMAIEVLVELEVNVCKELWMTIEVRHRVYRSN